MRERKWANPELIKGIGVITPPRHTSANPNADEYGSWTRGMRGRTLGIAPGTEIPNSVAVTATKLVKGSRYDAATGRWVKYEKTMPITEVRTVSTFYKPRTTHERRTTRTVAPVRTPEVQRLPSIHIGADDDN